MQLVPQKIRWLIILLKVAQVVESTRQVPDAVIIIVMVLIYFNEVCQEVTESSTIVIFIFGYLNHWTTVEVPCHLVFYSTFEGALLCVCLEVDLTLHQSTVDVVKRAVVRWQSLKKYILQAKASLEHIELSHHFVIGSMADFEHR